MTDSTVRKGKLLANIPADLPDEFFEVLAGNDQVKIERIVSSGHTSPDSGWYDQDQNEWVMVIQGNAEIEFEDGHTAQLAEGDYVNIPAHHRHRVTSTSASPKTVWLAVHY